MSDPSKLDRETLRRFLPTHEAVKAFENLFREVVETIPETIVEINEATQVPQRSNQDEFVRQGFAERLEILEHGESKQRLSQLEERVQMLEILVSKMQSISQLEARVRALEEMTGV